MLDGYLSPSHGFYISLCVCVNCLYVHFCGFVYMHVEIRVWYRASSSVILPLDIVRSAHLNPELTIGSLALRV